MGVFVRSSSVTALSATSSVASLGDSSSGFLVLSKLTTSSMSLALASRLPPSVSLNVSVPFVLTPPAAPPQQPPPSPGGPPPPPQAPTPPAEPPSRRANKMDAHTAATIAMSVITGASLLSSLAILVLCRKPGGLVDRGIIKLVRLALKLLKPALKLAAMAKKLAKKAKKACYNDGTEADKALDPAAMAAAKSGGKGRRALKRLTALTMTRNVAEKVLPNGATDLAADAPTTPFDGIFPDSEPNRVVVTDLDTDAASPLNREGVEMTDLGSPQIQSGTPLVCGVAPMSSPMFPPRRAPPPRPAALPPLQRPEKREELIRRLDALQRAQLVTPDEYSSRVQRHRPERREELVRRLEALQRAQLMDENDALFK